MKSYGIDAMCCHFQRPGWLIATVATLLCAGSDVLHAQQVRCFSLEFFYDSGVDDAVELQLALVEFAAKRTGLRLHFRDVRESEEMRKRVDEIAKYFRLPEVKLPAIYGLKNVLMDLTTREQIQTRLEQILTLTAYVQNGCPHCRAARVFFSKHGSRYPALKIIYREVVTDRTARDDMDELTRRYRRTAASLPVVHYCNGLTIGFDRESTTGRRIMQTLDFWSKACSTENRAATRQ